MDIISGEGRGDSRAATERVGRTKRDDDDRSFSPHANLVNERCLFVIRDSSDNDIGISHLEGQLELDLRSTRFFRDSRLNCARVMPFEVVEQSR